MPLGSTSTGTPFLYYGLVGGFGGSKVEQLLDLTTLGRPGQNITEITDGSPTYFDACENANLGYWAWYYPGNEFGPNNLSPRVGKFDSDTNIFYRAAGGILDVHVWEAGDSTGDPTIMRIPGREGWARSRVIVSQVPHFQRSPPIASARDAVTSPSHNW